MRLIGSGSGVILSKSAGKQVLLLKVNKLLIIARE